MQSGNFDCFNPKQNLLSTRPRATRTQARVQCMEAGKEERQNGHEGKKRQAPAAPARARKQIPGAHVKTQNRLVAHKVQVQQFLPGARQSTAPSQKTQGEAARSDRAATATAPQTPEANAPPLTLASGVGFWRAQESCGVTTTNSCYRSWSSVSSWPHALLCPWLQGELTQAHLAFEGHSIKVEAVRNDGGVLRQEVLLSIMRPPTDGRDRPAGHAPCAGRANEYEQERV
jgi:hypothetical protein